MAKIPTTKQMRKATHICGIEYDKYRTNLFSISSNNKDPKITGIDIKKEKSTLTLEGNPKNNPVAMVVPERLTAGKQAIPCPIPINIASRYPIGILVTEYVW